MPTALAVAVAADGGQDQACDWAGAPQGIGHLVATNLAREGGKVALVDRPLRGINTIT